MSSGRRIAFTASLLMGATTGLLSGCDDHDAPAVQQVQSAAKLTDARQSVASLQDDGSEAARTHFNWQMNCQGCHHPNGEGNEARDIPPLVALERFQRLPEGRAFLIQVPGMSRSKLSDEELTEMANWMMQEFATPQTSEGWEPYSEDEVAELRRRPITEGVRDYREKLMARLESAGSS